MAKVGRPKKSSTLENERVAVLQHSCSPSQVNGCSNGGYQTSIR